MYEWFDQVIQSGCKSPYEQRQCALALSRVLPLLRAECGDGVGGALLWQHNVTSKQLNAVLRAYMAQGAGDGVFWVRRLLSMLLRRINTGAPFGLAATASGAVRPPRLRLTMEHSELLRDIERGISGGVLTSEDWRHVRRFVCTYPVWDLAHISEITACDVSDWAEFRMGAAEPLSCVQSVRRFCGAWQAQHGQRLGNGNNRRQKLYHAAFPSGLPMHVAAFWGFYFKRPCVAFVTRLHHHLDQRHLKGTHRSQVVEAIKTFCLDLCTGQAVRGKDWDTEVQPTITANDIQAWVTKQTLMRYKGGGKLPTVIVRHIVAMNHFGSLLFGDRHEPVVSRTNMWRCATAVAMDRGSSLNITRKWRRTYSRTEVDSLLGACKCRRDRLLLLILTRAGLRSTALRTLQIRNVVCGDEGLALEKGQRWHHFFIDADVRACLEAYLTHEHPDRQSPYLFPHHTQHHQPMPSSQLRTWLHRLAAKCEISGSHVTIHSFRRYVVTTLLESGNSIEYVARYVGHASPHTTQQYWVTSPAQLIRQMSIPWLGKESNNSKKDDNEVWVPVGLLTEAHTMLSTMS